MIDLLKRLIAYFRPHRSPIDLWGDQVVVIGPVKVRLNGWELSELARLTAEPSGVDIAGDIRNYVSLRSLGFVAVSTDHITSNRFNGFKLREGAAPRPPTARVKITREGRRYIDNLRLRSVVVDDPCSLLSPEEKEAARTAWMSEKEYYIHKIALIDEGRITQRNDAAPNLSSSDRPRAH